MEEQGKEKTPADLQARIEKLEKSLNNTWLIMDMLILALEQKQVISKADLKEAASVQRSEILKVHPEFAAGWPDPLCKFDKPFDRMVVYQTKEAAEQASKERIKAFPYGTPINKIFRSTSEAFCDSLLAKIESHCDLAEINEMVRTLSYFEKTDTLPKAEKLNKIAIAFGRYVEEEVKKRSNLSGEPTFELTDSIRCLHRLSVILWDMLNAKLPIQKCR